MPLTENGFYCTICTKHVIDLSGKSKHEIIKAIDEAEGNLCAIVPSSVLQQQIKTNLFKVIYVAVLSFLLLLVNPKQSLARKHKDTFDFKISFEKTDSNKIILAGKIIDKETRKPLDYANLSVQCKGIIIAQTQTDDEGEYHINFYGRSDSTVEVYIGYLGYNLIIKDIELIHGKKTRLDIAMSPGKRELMLIGLLAPSKSKQSDIVKPDGTEKTFRRKDMERMGY